MGYYINLNKNSLDYVTSLRQDVNSYHPKPNNLKELPGVNPSLIEVLARQRIKNTLHLYPEIITSGSRAKLTAEIAQPEPEIAEIAFPGDRILTCTK